MKSIHPHRRHPRFPAELPAWCLVDSDSKTSRETEGRTGNVSLEGLLLFLPDKVVPGTVLRLRLGLPEGPITAHGIVVWYDRQLMGEGRIPHGLRFLRFAEDGDLTHYRRFLSQIAANYGAQTKP